MTDDWARRHIDVHKQKQQEQQNRQIRASLAQGGAPSMLQRILDRIRQDLQTFHNAGVLLNLKITKEAMPEKFVVSSPSTRSEVELDIILIKYHHAFLGKDNRPRPEQRSGTLRICSDLSGVLTVYKNGDGEAFADESEVSEFLLRPVLDYIEE